MDETAQNGLCRRVMVRLLPMMAIWAKKSDSNSGSERLTSTYAKLASTMEDYLGFLCPQCKHACDCLLAHIVNKTVACSCAVRTAIGRAARRKTELDQQVAQHNQKQQNVWVEVHRPDGLPHWIVWAESQPVLACPALLPRCLALLLLPRRCSISSIIRF